MTGAELAAIRKAAGLSQSALARRAEISWDAVSYWERKAMVNPRSWAVRRMATVLDLPVKFTSKRARAPWGDSQQKLEQSALKAACAAVQAQRAAKVRIRCGAKTRKGTPCRCKSEPGKQRCKFHGGLSTGAKTTEGRKRIAEAQRKRWARWRLVQGSIEPSTHS